jgi:hypothetical protein
VAYAFYGLFLQLDVERWPLRFTCGENSRRSLISPIGTLRLTFVNLMRRQAGVHGSTDDGSIVAEFHRRSTYDASVFMTAIDSAIRSLSEKEA